MSWGSDTKEINQGSGLGESVTTWNEPVEVQLRGRGVTRFDGDDLVLASRAGQDPPRPTIAANLRVGDYVGIEYGGIWASESPPLPRLDDRPLHGSEKHVNVPDTLSTELAFLLGAYLAEGHTTHSNWSVIVTNSVESVLQRVQAAWRDIFGLEARITRQRDRCPGVVVSSKRLVEWMTMLGCGHRASNKAVPEVIRRASRPDVLAFVQGAALDAYTTSPRGAKWAICLDSEQAITQLQELVTRLGVVNNQIAKTNKVYDKTYYELYAAGPWGQDLCRLVPFLEPDKQARALQYLEVPFRSRHSDVIPGITGPELYASCLEAATVARGRGLVASPCPTCATSARSM